jgi:CDP-paratose 2-epimerase
MSRNVLITGGAGFIGINTSEFYLKNGDSVTILDNFSRKGSKENIKSLKDAYKSQLKIVEQDVRDNNQVLKNSVQSADLIFHLAGQVAVTTSIANPREDFEINALGTFNVLELARKSKKNPIFIYSSTNKVYGNLNRLKIVKTAKRYKFADLPYGVNESYPVDFYSPYGCSKGTADQYVHDYHRIYGLRSIVFRQSCIYGPHQFGVEDQGWVSWFLIALRLGQKITIYGDGKQVRDLLYVSDLVNGYNLAISNIDKTSGKIYNIGGGINNSISIWKDLEPVIRELTGQIFKVAYADERPGDQKIYISDTRLAKKDFGWKPMVGVKDGIGKLHDWIKENEVAIRKVRT